jgi:hypothetical protein
VLRPSTTLHDFPETQLWPFRVGRGWRAHCPDNRGHSRIW